MKNEFNPKRQRTGALQRLALFGACVMGVVALRGEIGADQPWTTYEAETMHTNGAVLGPSYAPYRVETESSGERCVRLAAAGDFVEFTAATPANALVLRYSLPDAAKGGGVSTTLALFVNGRAVRTLALTSRYSHVYGKYPFSNNPAEGHERNFYDEARVKNLEIQRGDVVRLQRIAADTAFCIVDLVDLENVAPPLAAPANALSLLDFGAGGKGGTDDTTALRDCVVAARREGRIVWVPAGDYKITGDIVVPSGVTIQGAGMWQTTFVGEEKVYGEPARRVRFKLSGEHIRLADFAILGRLDYRNDSEPNDGIVGAGCSDSTIERIWVEHTKVGAWIYNGVRLRIEGCRFRDLMADGVNLCVGANGCVIENCTARGTGDDCFAIWPVPADQGFEQGARPGDNVIRRCTGQLPFLANGGSLYGGANNRIEECRFTDITTGCGILISSTFPTADEARKIDNNFSGETVVENCELTRCGGYDHDWAWRAALQICLDRRVISGLRISHVMIRDSLSDGISVVAPGRAKGEGTLTDAVLGNVTVSGVGLGDPARHGLWIRKDAAGRLTLVGSSIAEVCNESKEFEIVAQPE
ncbi:MAG TPA: glycosyl hydrolase family 28-related protein [Opitutus sp.]|nr:glycosyl hydrolase family 28-related protein [Opitutus sp.]